MKGWAVLLSPQDHRSSLYDKRASSSSSSSSASSSW